MSVLDKQAELGKNLYQINANTLRGLAELQRDNVEKYFELNKAFAEKLPEVNSFTSFFELQREYNQNIWEGVKASVQSRTEIVRGALEETGEVFRAAFKPEDEKPAKAKAKPRKKAKPVAKAKVAEKPASVTH
jgi:hypothetical protein